jgi:putative ABC transport system permease protein
VALAVKVIASDPRVGEGADVPHPGCWHPPAIVKPDGAAGYSSLASPPVLDDIEKLRGMRSAGIEWDEVTLVRFVTLIAKNVLNRPVRTALTALGLSVAIAAVIVLVGISWNFQRSFLAIYQAKGIDIVVVHAGSSNQLASSLDVRLADRLRQIDGVADVAPTLVDTVAFEDKGLASVLVDGWEPGSLLFRGIRILSGRSLEKGDDRAALLGRVLALNLDKKVGDKLDVSGESFRVVGIFESDSLFENGAMIVPIRTLQKMMGREGQATGLVIAAKSSDRAAIDALRRRIEAEVPGVAATPARDYVAADTQIRLAKAMSWTTAVVAMILGAVGMLNTMLMSIFERTREIGILRAVGWRRGRVLALVLGEALIIALAGTVLGGVLAAVGLRALMLSPTARGFIEPNIPPEVLGISLIMGVGLSLLGGLYPAARAAALDPTEALRYE